MAARLVDYEGAKHGVALEQPKKSGCALWFIIIVIVLAAGAFAAWDSFGNLLEKSGDSSPAPIVEALEAGAPEPAVAVAPNPPSRAETKFTDPYTLTVIVSEAVHVKITQQADGKVLVDELVKPAIPINAVAKSAIVVESKNTKAVGIRVGSMMYQSSSPDALSFIVSPKEGR